VPDRPDAKLYRPAAPIVRAERSAVAYAELCTTTNFSFLRGASHPEEFVASAAELGYHALGVTDRNSLAGIVRMHAAAKSCGLKLVVGTQLDLAEGVSIRVWPEDRAAYARLCRLLTLGKSRVAKAEFRLSLDEFLEQSDGMQVAIVPDIHDAGQSIDALRAALGKRLSILAWLHYDHDNPLRLQTLIDLSRAFDTPLLASNDPHMHDPCRRRLGDVVACIREKHTLARAGMTLSRNAERYLKPPDAMHRLFVDHPQAVRRAMQVAQACTFSLDDIRYEYPHELVPEGVRPIDHLRRLVEEGIITRYPAGIPDSVRALIEHEMSLIEQLKFEYYFLTVHDLVTFARSRGILCQGRGSAANSVVCYCLGVTSVDPTKIDLLFERFISAARNEPPDIDIDFEHERREEVLQYIYRKYGRDRAGMTAEVITYRGRSAVREVGKALGLGLDQVDQMARRLDWWHRGVLSDQQVREAGLDPADPTVAQVIELSGQLLGFPRHLGQHVGGMVITHSPLCELVPIENAAMQDRTIIEWDKDDIDALGMIKVDCLGLGMLSVISRGLALLGTRHGLTSRDREGAVAREQQAASHGEGHRSLSVAARGQTRLVPLDLASIPSDDPAVYDMFCRADTVGVFQIESRAQMSMLPRLRPRTYYDLVIEVAIVRPGPIQGDMVHPYLRRRSGKEAVTFPSEALRSVLGKTLGVPLFQEQAMKVAMVAAGFSAEEADQLRRAMAAWRKTDRISQFYDKIIEGMIRNGYDRDFAERTFNQIKGFGEYGFPESHAASFAHLVYVSGWLKHHHPAVFCAALINSQPMGFYAPAQIVRDAVDHGVEVRHPDVNASDWDCTLEETQRTRDTETEWRRAVRLGLRMVKGMQPAWVRHLVETRSRLGCFTSVDDLHRRAGLTRTTLKALAEADAFTSMGLSRREALWRVLAIDDTPAPLFDTPADDGGVVLPVMPRGQEVLSDYATVGLSLKAHPIALVRELLDRQGIVAAGRVKQLRHGSRVSVCGLVLIRQRPGTASGVVFITLEDETGIVNLIVRPHLFDRYRQAARHAAIMQCDGWVERQGDVIHVSARRMVDRSDLIRGVAFHSRDFH
jgi:error-prone DNA polymerase